MEELARLGGFRNVCKLLLKEPPAEDDLRPSARKKQEGRWQLRRAFDARVLFLERLEIALHVLALAAADLPCLC